MVKPHPHAGTIYKIIARQDGAFEVGVSLPKAKTPVTVTGLSTRADAERWIAGHQASIAAGAPNKRRAFLFRRPPKPKP